MFFSLTAGCVLLVGGIAPQVSVFGFGNGEAGYLYYHARHPQEKKHSDRIHVLSLEYRLLREMHLDGWIRYCTDQNAGMECAQSDWESHRTWRAAGFADTIVDPHDREIYNTGDQDKKTFDRRTDF